jgi:hypothetical protein
MNNYWVTNFNADQRGGHTWTYYISSAGDISGSFASKFGWGSRVPFLTRILPGDGTGDGMKEGSFIEGWPSGVLLISSRPVDNGKSVLIHLRETGGKEAQLILKNGISGDLLVISGADVNGKPLADSDNSLKPLESKFFLLKTGF